MIISKGPCASLIILSEGSLAGFCTACSRESEGCACVLKSVDCTDVSVSVCSIACLSGMVSGVFVRFSELKLGFNNQKPAMDPRTTIANTAHNHLLEVF